MSGLRAAVLLFAVASSLLSGGCYYSSVATSGDAVVIVRNDLLLFGALRKVYVCRLTEEGVTQCKSQQSP